MKKVITYPEEEIMKIKGLLSGVSVVGPDNWTRMAMVTQILNDGMIGEIKEEGVK